MLSKTNSLNQHEICGTIERIARKLDRRFRPFIRFRDPDAYNKMENGFHKSITFEIVIYEYTL